MDIRISMRQVAADRWIASSDGDLSLEVQGQSRDHCLDRLREALPSHLLRQAQEDPLTLIVEVHPILAGVAEAAQVMGWDKRRVITYIDRGHFPEPMQALASGRVWMRSDVERYADEWRARQAERKRRSRRAEPPPGGSL
jgi:hypothetical protein